MPNKMASVRALKPAPAMAGKATGPQRGAGQNGGQRQSRDKMPQGDVWSVK
jgi:hypothetical protein